MANYQTNMNMRYNHQGNSYQQRQMYRREKMESRCGEHDDKMMCEKTKEYRRETDKLYGFPLAMAYVPWQSWCNIYDVEKGFHRGTIFEELDKPFLGRGGCNR